MGFTTDEFRKKFPNLTRELEQNAMRVKIDSVRSETKDDERRSKKFDRYMPDVVDFLRRCDNFEEADEIIGFLEKRGEISNDHADKLRKQLHEKGLRSFGSKKEHGYYLRQE